MKLQFVFEIALEPPPVLQLLKKSHVVSITRVMASASLLPVTRFFHPRKMLQDLTEEETLSGGIGGIGVSDLGHHIKGLRVSCKSGEDSGEIALARI